MKYGPTFWIVRLAVFAPVFAGGWFVATMFPDHQFLAGVVTATVCNMLHVIVLGFMSAWKKDVQRTIVVIPLDRGRRGRRLPPQDVN